MANAFFYLMTVLIWGSSWLAIKFQIGVVPVDVSVAYRFAIAAVVLVVFCLASGRSLSRFSLSQHGFMALQGFFLFGLNYLLFYIATPMLTTGLIATIFSTIIIFNIVFGALLFRTPVRPRVVLGALIGIGGIGLVFRPELAAFDLQSQALAGIGISLLATASASLGNLVSLRNQNAGMPVIETNTFSMAYGAVMMTLWALATGRSFTFDPSVAYVGSLLFLAVFASAIAFWCYLTLIGRIGADRGAYATVVFPIVALGLSTAFEDFVWTGDALAGVGLVLLGNLLVLMRLGRRRKPAPEAATG
ncbi:MAG: DMT family transporter [Alphaproteobacteria bacterium]|nr:DMT family transporter [Alphaproteobacteria bacterium]